MKMTHVLGTVLQTASIMLVLIKTPETYPYVQ